jgi:predicted DNA-binding ribbon-helix-helix protein
MTWRPTEEATERTIRNVVVDGRRTSFRLEKAFWDAIEDFAAEKGITRHQLIAKACENQERDGVSMSSAVRVFLIREAMEMADAPLGDTIGGPVVDGDHAALASALAQSLVEALRSAEISGQRPGSDAEVQRIYGRLGSLLRN